jgi:uncharacterized membrane protein YdjX (TVP38/TMEM64 family)
MRESLLTEGKRLTFTSRLAAYYRKHSTLFLGVLGFIALWLVLAFAGMFYQPLSPEVLLTKESADRAKQYILSFGGAAPLFFIVLHVLEVVLAPIPGQAAGFAGGYIFGWKPGVLYTMVGLSIGSLIVFLLSRKLGRAFVERFNGREAMKDFEELLLGEGASHGAYAKSRDAVSSHGLLTFFVIMLLPGLPDDLVCFVAGLSRIPIWQLMLVVIAGRFPGMLVLAMAGDGFSQAETNRIFYLFIAATLAITVLYFWKKSAFERLMRRFAGIK